MHIASRALTEADARDIVVTQTVRDLATETDLAFTPHGAVGLHDVPGGVIVEGMHAHSRVDSATDRLRQSTRAGGAFLLVCRTAA